MRQAGLREEDAKVSASASANAKVNASASAIACASSRVRCYRGWRRERASAERCEGDDARSVREVGDERLPFFAPGLLFFLLLISFLLS